MRLKQGYIKVAAFEGFAVIPAGEESSNSRFMLTLNNTAAEIWDMLSDGRSADEIAAALSDKYGISAQKAKADVDGVVDTLLNAGVLEK